VGEDQPVIYRERPSTVPGVTLWQRQVAPVPRTMRIMPDGCLDLLWDGRRLLIAGPDTRAREHVCPAGVAYAALRFSGGTGPALLGIPADVLRDQTVRLEELLPPVEVRLLTERVAAGPVAALERWSQARAGAHPVDPLGPRVLAMARAGLPVSDMAARLGLSPRQLHRRCLSNFGYGPRRLTRVLRFSRLCDEGGSGVPLAQLAHAVGYADQAHLSREVRELAGTTPARLVQLLTAG